jgi:excisionase family DNA binding protein
MFLMSISAIAGGGLDQLLRIPEVADRLSISDRAVWRLIATRKLPAPVKQGRCSCLFEADLATYLSGLRDQRKLEGGGL